MAGPSWWHADWSIRIPVLLDTSASSGTVDATIAIPTTMQLLWDNVDSNGYEIRVTKADGVTQVPHQLAAGWDTATQTGTIELDNFAVPVTNEMSLVWVYCGNTGASDGSTSFTASTPITGYMTPERPSNNLVAGTERLGATTAQVAFAKNSNDVAFVYMPLALELAGRCGPDYAGGDGFEGIQNWLYSVEASGSPVASAIDVTLCRVTDCGSNGRELWVRLAIQAGSDTTNYITYVDVQSTEGRRKRHAFEFQVRDVVETS
mgnify:CR=1 FL=1